MKRFLRSLFRPRSAARPAREVDYDVSRDAAGRVVLALRPDGPRIGMSPAEARNLSVLLAMAAGAADGRDD